MINGFSSTCNLVHTCTLIHVLRRSGFGLLIGKFPQVLTELSAGAMIMAGGIIVLRFY